MKTLNTHAPSVIDYLIEAVLHSILLTPTNFPLTDGNNSSIVWLKEMKILITKYIMFVPIAVLYQASS